MNLSSCPLGGNAVRWQSVLAVKIMSFSHVILLFTLTTLRVSGWGTTNVSCQLKFWPFVSC